MKAIVLRIDKAGSTQHADYAKFDEGEKARVSIEMSDLGKDLERRGLDADFMVTSGFDAAGEIIEAANRAGADLIVMSTHGRSGLGRWVLGNVAEKVLRHVKMPLLLVHANAG